MPFDSHLRPGGVIDVANEMDPKTRRSFYEIAAAVAVHFAATTHGSRDQWQRVTPYAVNEYPPDHADAGYPGSATPNNSPFVCITLKRNMTANAASP